MPAKHTAATLKTYIRTRRTQVNRALRRMVPSRNTLIHRAMRYSLFAGGKRLRPILCVVAAEVVGGATSDVMSAACGIECIHTYSLIHDDLPSMDNANTRRGQLTSHRKFDEGTAILAGDALLSLGFELIARGNHAPRRVEALRATARMTGTDGLVGGQVMDLRWQKQNKAARRRTSVARRTLVMQDINANKTAKLMALSTQLGALLGGGTPKQVRALERYGYWLGMTFQITDDLLDGEGLVEIIGIEAARCEAERTARRARGAVRSLGKRTQPLMDLTDAIVWRTT